MTTTTVSPDDVASIDPRTGEVVEIVTRATSAAEVDTIVRAAVAAAPWLRERATRSTALRAIADALEGAREQIVPLAMRETALPRPRLDGELTRTVFQARLFADVVDEGAFLEATIDHAGDTPMGPGPDLRRLLVPLGPVAVFGASNFPLAFSVPGGDTVSAIAAGCPVVVKAHGSHPALSALVAATMLDALGTVGAPTGLLGIVFGTQAGVDLLRHPEIKAAGFTGSLSGGQALQRIAQARPEPIPFYGELASINPVVLTPAAVAARGDAIADGLVTSITGSGGQLCTKPGVVLVPRGVEGDALVARAADAVRAAPASTLLNARIAESYDSVRPADDPTAAVRVVAEGTVGDGGFAVAARLLETDADALVHDEPAECFGPTTLLVRYAADQLAAVVTGLPGSLTATVHAEPEDDVSDLLALLEPRAGRILFNGFPTGVLVSWAQHHGGPWPSTNTQHTSVGTSAVRRFQRPVTWQSAPASVLPAELRDGPVDVPRRVDGRLELPAR